MKVTNKLYKGKVILNFNSFRHKYTVDDEEITSVTKILSVINKPMLVSWASRMATESVEESIKPGVSYDEMELFNIFETARKAHWQKKTDAGNIGTKVHEWVEDYINGDNPGIPVNEMLRDSVNNFLYWVKESKVEFVLAEQPVYSREHKYAGIIDFICKIGGELYVGDIKTSKGIYPEYLLQTSAYRSARAEEFPEEKYVGQVIVRIGKDGSFETAVLKDEELYQEMVIAFLSAQKLHNTLNKLDKYELESK